MNERQKNLLQFIIEEHVGSGETVGSKLITDKYMSDLSGATVRNEMQELEHQGFLTHPHTSAGRLPTEAGYRFYLENMLSQKNLSARVEKALLETMKMARSLEEKVKLIAKKTAQLCGEAVVVGFNPDNVYYTGLANLFNKPEFSNQELVVSLSQVIDHLDEVMSKIDKRLDEDISVLLGSDNPFGKECGSVLTTYKFSQGRGVIGLLGPIRMDYGQNIAYLKYIKKIIED